MDKALFKSSEELKIFDNDPVFMARFSNNLQLEVPLKLKRKRSSWVYVLSASSFASVVLWFLWPHVGQFLSSWLNEVQVSLGISSGIILAVLGLMISVALEVKSEGLSEF